VQSSHLNLAHRHQLRPLPRLLRQRLSLLLHRFPTLHQQLQHLQPLLQLPPCQPHLQLLHLQHLQLRLQPPCLPHLQHPQLPRRPLQYLQLQHLQLLHHQHLRLWLQPMLLQPCLQHPQLPRRPLQHLQLHLQHLQLLPQYLQLWLQPQLLQPCLQHPCRSLRCPRLQHPHLQLRHRLLPQCLHRRLLLNQLCQ